MSPWRLWAVPLSVGAVWTAGVWRHRFLMDAAFLDARIGRNLAEGAGWTYSGPATSDLCNSPLMVLSAAVGHLFGLPPMATALAVGWLAGAALLWLTWRAMHHMNVGPWATDGLVLALASTPITTAWATGGMGDMPLALGLWATVSSLLIRRSAATGIAGSVLASVSHPSGPLCVLATLAFCASVLVTMGRRQDLPLPRAARRTLRVRIAPVGPALVATLATTAGTVTARMAAFGNPLPWALQTLEVNALTSASAAAEAAVVMGLPLLWLGGLGVAIRRYRPIAGALAGLVLLTTGLATLASPADPFGRVWLVAAAPGTVALGLWAQDLWRERRRGSALGLVALTLAVAPLPALDIHLFPRALGAPHTAQSAWRATRDATREQLRMGQHLDDVWGSAGGLVVSRPGAQAWPHRGPIHDASGRTDPSAWAERTHRGRVAPGWYGNQSPAILRAKVVDGTRADTTREAAAWNRPGATTDISRYHGGWLLVLRPNHAQQVRQKQWPVALERLVRAAPSDASARTERGAGGVLVAGTTEPRRVLVTSGDGPRARVIDETGAVVYAWEVNWMDVWPEISAQGPGTRYLRRAWVLDDGDLLVLFEGVGVARLDRKGAVRWATHNGATGDGQVHDGTRLTVFARSVGDHELRTELQILDVDSGQVLRRHLLNQSLRDANLSLPTGPDPVGASGLSPAPPDNAGRTRWLLSLRGAGQLVLFTPETGQADLVPTPDGVRPAHALWRNDNELDLLHAPIDSTGQPALWRFSDGDWHRIQDLPQSGSGAGRLVALAEGGTLLTDTADATVTAWSKDHAILWRWRVPWRTRSGRQVAAVFQAEPLAVQSPPWLAETPE
jgi:hypothetical protein